MLRLPSRCLVSHLLCDRRFSCGPQDSSRPPAPPWRSRWRRLSARAGRTCETRRCPAPLRGAVERQEFAGGGCHVVMAWSWLTRSVDLGAALNIIPSCRRCGMCSPDSGAHRTAPNGRCGEPTRRVPIALPPSRSFCGLSAMRGAGALLRVGGDPRAGGGFCYPSVRGLAVRGETGAINPTAGRAPWGRITRLWGATALSRLALTRTSTSERDLNLRPLAGSGEIEKPRAWTAHWVKHRMVEAFTIERRIPTSGSARQARGQRSRPPTASAIGSTRAN